MLTASKRWSHLHFVCTLANGDGEVVVLNMTTLRTWSDDVCRLDVGDHPDVVHPSCIDYARGELRKAEHIEEALKVGLFVKRTPASPEVLDRIRQGAALSEFTEPKIQTAIAQCPWTP